jgi:hypothetical protein
MLENRHPGRCLPGRDWWSAFGGGREAEHAFGFWWKERVWLVVVVVVVVVVVLLPLCDARPFVAEGKRTDTTTITQRT